MATVRKHSVKTKNTVKSRPQAVKSTKAYFSKKESIKLGFELAKENIVFFIGLFIIIVVISAGTSALQIGLAFDRQPFIYLILNIAIFIVNAIVAMGIIKISLAILDKKKTKFSDLFHTKPLVNYVFATIIRGVITFIGFILLIIPGIIFSIRLQFVTYLVVDKNMAAVEAIKKSWNMTAGNTWNLLFFGILLMLVNILGILLLLVGLFVTIPLTMLATAFVYRKLLQSKYN